MPLEQGIPVWKGWSSQVAWGMIQPDPGTEWVHFDLDALHARIAAAYTGDQEDLDWFARGVDIHTLTCCRMFGVSVPPIETKALHEAQECEGWRQSWSPPWTGEKDRRRRLAKVMRYALLLGINEMAVLESHEVEELGLSREEALRFARLYLRAKPALVAGKQRIFREVAQAGSARSFMGRLRRLYGDAKQRGKDGWSHILQGGEQDIMDQIKLDWWREFPESVLHLDSHDGLTVGMPGEMAPRLPRLRAIVERTWAINGQSVFIPASWEIIRP